MKTGDIKLSIKQARKVLVVEKRVEGKMRNSDAAKALGLSVRQIQRIGKEFKIKGHAALIHGNTGRKPSHTLQQNIKDLVLEKATLYSGTSWNHIAELLKEKDGISISAKSVARIFKEKGIPSPCSHKAPRKRLRRERRKRLGELVQIDASAFDWLSNGTTTELHGGIDDATGRIVALWLTETEQLNGYFHVLDRMIRILGVPRALYMDGHTIFFSPKDGKLTEEEELEGKTVALTQFGNALNILGVQPIRASSPQAKGRIERLWGTLQKRLPVDMKVAGIKSMEEGNRFLESYIHQHNAHFAVEAVDTENAFMPGPSEELLRFILCIRETRKTTGDSSISWQGKKYVIEEKAGVQKLFRRGTSVSVLTLMDGSLAVQNEQEIFFLKEIPRAVKAQQTDTVTEAEAITPRTPYKPKKDHPWRNFKIHSKQPQPLAATGP